MSTAAADGYEGRTGGKLQRRLPRRGAATPYDRPPVAGRGLRGARIDVPTSLAEGGRRAGWISKLVDPASTLITKGATRLFSSVFRKRLGAPPTAEIPVENFESVEAFADAFDSTPFQDAHERGAMNVEDTHEGDGISEFERLLKQKTFTREEYDRLTELLRLRLVGSSDEGGKKRSQQSVSALDYKKQEVEKIPVLERKQENSVGILSEPGPHLNVSEEELASPAEVAKAYMGSRPSKVSPSSLSLRSQMIRETTASPSFAGFTPRLTAPPFSSKPVVQFPGVPVPPDSGYTTPVSRGRSAIYRMSRSPYFRPPPTVAIKEGKKVDEVHAGPSLQARWTPESLTISSGKQVLKRRSSVLESDIGSVGPIRRIRMKSNLATPMSSTANVLENGEKASDFVPVPHQSREMAKRILQQLDKLVPSPKDKPSETKTIFREESPSKLTVDMLHGQALKSTTEKDLTKLFNMEANGKPDAKVYPHEGPEPVHPTTKGKVEGNGPSVSDAVESMKKRSVFKMQAPLELLDFENDGPGEKVMKPALPVNGPSVTKKDAGFTFQVSSASAPVFSFSSNTTPLMFSSSLAEMGQSLGGPSISAEKSEKIPESGFLFKSAAATSSSFSFAMPTAQSNGSPTPASPSLFASFSSSSASSTLFSSSSTTPSFQFATASLAAPSTSPAVKESIPSLPAFSAPTLDSAWKPAKESIFGMPTSSAVTKMPPDSSLKPVKESIFGMPTSSTATTLTESSLKPAKESIFGLPTSSSMITAADSAPKPVKESIFGLTTSSSTTALAESAPKPAKELTFNLPSSSSTTSAESVQKPATELIFGLPTPAVTTSDSSVKPAKESILDLPTSAVAKPTDSAPKPAKESIFALPTTSSASTTAAPTFAGSGGSLFGFTAGTAASSLFGQSTASQFNLGSTSSSSSLSSTVFSAASSQSTAASSLFGTGFSSVSSAAPVFSFTQAAAPASPSVFGFSSPAPFGSPSPAVGGFKLASSPGNDQMNEDSMTDDAVLAAPPVAATPSTPLFGAPAAAASVFQFASPQSFMPSQQPFQPGPGSEFQGSFSMGSGGGGGDKSGRRFIKAKREKHRKK